MRKLSKPSPQPQQTTPQLPLQAEQSSAAAECTEDPEDPPTSDLPHCDSPSNLFSLERHLSGEITKTPEKATKSISQQTDSVNQQPEPVVETVVPEFVQVTDSEQTATLTVSEPNQQQPEQPPQPSPTKLTFPHQLQTNLKTKILHKRLFQNLFLRQLFLNLYKLQSLNKLWQ